jgi:hypothetical protein
MSFALTVDDLLHAASTLRYREAKLVSRIYTEVFDEGFNDELIELIEDLAGARIEWYPLAYACDDALKVGTAHWIRYDGPRALIYETVEKAFRLALKALTVEGILDTDEMEVALLPVQSLFC